MVNPCFEHTINDFSFPILISQAKLYLTMFSIIYVITNERLTVIIDILKLLKSEKPMKAYAK